MLRLPMLRKHWPLIIIYIIVILLFYPILNVYFTGDDFFHFKISQTDGNITSFIKLFGFYAFEERGIAFYRPVFREALYNIFYLNFGLNVLPFRVLQLMLHFVNIFLVYIFTQKLFNKKIISYFAALFFGITSANVAILYYIAGGIQAQGATLFLLLSLILFLNKNKLYLAAAVAALASHEMAIIITPLLAGLIIINNKNKYLIKIVKSLWPLILITILYLILNFFVIGFSESEVQYSPTLNPKKFVNTISWYTAWGMGLPEMTIDFVQSGLKLDPRLMRYWGDYYKIIFPSFFVSLFIIALSFIKVARKLIKNKQIWLQDTCKLCLLTFWFIAGLTPVVFLPWHKSAYYLATVLPALWILIGYVVYKFNTKLLYLLILILLILNITSIKLGDKTYPAAKRGRIAEKLINDFKMQYPALPKEAVIYIKNDLNYDFIADDWGGSSKQASFILSGSDALQLLYDDESLEVYYEDFDILPKELLDEDEVFDFVANID